MAAAEGLERRGRRVREPIIVIGAGRSGTSLLAKVIESHPDVAYLPEPRPIWMYRNADRPDHVLGRGDLTPEIADYVDRRFAEFLARSGARRFAEKTPSNCLRIPFIHALYPDCRVINIVRDGRAVVRSTVQIRARGPRKGLLRDRLRTTPVRDWPRYVPMFFRTVWRTNVLGKPARHWGAQPRGWRDWMDLPPHQAAARQWRGLVEASVGDGRRLPPENYLELRYEDFIANPEATIARVTAFTGLRPDPAMLACAGERIDPERGDKWSSSLSEAQEAEVLEIIGPCLERLGYLGGAAG